MKTKKIIALSLSAFLIGSALVGCGNSGGVGTSSAPASSVLPSSSTPASSSSSSSSSSIALKDAGLAFKDSYAPGKVYDGTPVAVPTTADYSILSDGTVEIAFYAGESKLDAAPSDAGTYSVVLAVAKTAIFDSGSASKSFEITKATWSLSFPSDYAPDKTYDGTPVSVPLVEEGVRVEWYSDATLLSSAPSEAGIYTIKLVKAGDKNHEEAIVSKDVVIGKAKGTVNFPEGYDPSKVYDGTPVSAPTTGEGVSVEWYSGDTLLKEAPKDAGSYTVTIRQAADNNHTAASASKEFTISQATGNVVFKDTYSPSKVYDSNAVSDPLASDYTTNCDGAASVEYFQNGTKLASAPSVPGSYSLTLTLAGSANVTSANVSKDFVISDYTTAIIENEANIAVTLDVNGTTSLTKGEAGELIVKGWWANLLLSGASIPANATELILHLKSDTALTAVEYNYSYPGVSLGSGTIATIGTEYSDVKLSLAHNGCPLAKLAFLLSGATLTIASITFTIPTSSIPAGQTGIFTHLGTAYASVSTEAFRGSSACTFFNNASDDALVFGGQWWDEVLFNGTTGIVIPSGKTKMVLSMKGSVAFHCLYVFSGTPVNFVYDESAGFALTTSYQNFTIDLNSATMVNSFGFCTCNNMVYIQSVTFE
jgi:hypothetical protein